jgi:hypothetical protein
MIKKIFFLCYIFILITGFEYPKIVNMNDVIIQKGLLLAKLNAKYEANTLDKSIDERLTILDNKFDCVTFVEYCLAHALVTHQPQHNSMESCVTQLRYRNGQVDGYGSRLHYFSEWILQLQHNGYGRDITAQLGGIPIEKTINYMSKNAQSYPKINKSNLPTVIKSEKYITAATRYIVPKEKIKSIENQLQSGDIVAFATSIPGLDYTHTGFVYKDKSGISKLLHASLSEGKVVVSEASISDYITKQSKMNGITIIRIN